MAGNEGVAEVVSAGSAVKTVSRGDWVVMRGPGFGTWRTHASAAESDVLRIANRAGLTPTQAGTVSVNPCTAYRMLRGFAALREGDWFVQNGANSGVGRAAIQMGRRWGYKSINVVRDRPGVTELKKELEHLGADVVLTEQELAEHGRELAGSRAVKLGLNCVGGKSATQLAKMLATDGHLVTYGAMARKPVELPAGLLIFKNLVFAGFWVSRWSQAHPEEKKRTVDEVLDWMRDGSFKDVPVQEIEWDMDTKESVLIDAVQGTLEGFRGGKGVFVFKE